MTLAEAEGRKLIPKTKIKITTFFSELHVTRFPLPESQLAEDESAASVAAIRLGVHRRRRPVRENDATIVLAQVLHDWSRSRTYDGRCLKHEMTVSWNN